MQSTAKQSRAKKRSRESDTKPIIITFKHCYSLLCCCRRQQKCENLIEEYFSFLTIRIVFVVVNKVILFFLMVEFGGRLLFLVVLHDIDILFDV